MLLAGRARTTKKPRRPRAPLPRQRGGPHEDKTRRPFRQRKHRRPVDREAPDPETRDG